MREGEREQFSTNLSKYVLHIILSLPKSILSIHEDQCESHDEVHALAVTNGRVVNTVGQ